MKITFEIALLLPLVALVLGSLLTLCSHPHWFIRGWDFPRVQIIVLGWLFAGSFAVYVYFGGSPTRISFWWFLGFATVLTLWHGFRILPYTPLFPPQSKSTKPTDLIAPIDDPRTIRLVLSNVEQENQEYARWLEIIRASDPDVVVVLETDQRWVAAAEPLIDRFAYRITQPQDNWYGMMLWSRLPIKNHELRFLVQQDVPSIDATIELDNGKIFRLVAVHPRPPEPWQGNDATARDAELTLWGKELEREELPVIIGGDLNDVAWSSTSRLFLRTSGLLDPRRGRGFFNTFHADHWYLRYPLDHVFHSRHFTVSRIQRLSHVGSDHYPMLIDLRLEPWRQDDHDVMEEKPGDESEVESRVQQARDAEEVDGEAVHRDPDHAIQD